MKEKDKDGSKSRETACFEAWYEVKDVPSRTGISEYGAWLVFSIVKSFLHDSRKAAKITLFEEFLYMVAPWSSLNDMSETSEALPTVARLKWANPCAEDSYDVSYVPLMTSKDVGTKNADQHNGDIVSQLLQKSESMVVLATHNSLVVPLSGSLRKHKGEKVRMQRRVINLIEVAGRFITAFTRYSERQHNILPLLRSHFALLLL